MTNDPHESPLENDDPSSRRSTRLRIFIESIARAGLAAIPIVGAAIEKASFGFKDALAAADLHALVQSIETQLRSHTCEGEPLSDDVIERLTDAVLASPRATALADVVEAASLRTNAALGEILLQIADRGAVEEESARRAMAELDKLQAGQREIAHIINNAADREQELLGQILTRLDQSVELTGRRPAEVLRTLDSLSVRKLLVNVAHIGAAARHHSNRPNPFVTVDFSEIYGYVNWPSDHEDLFLADAALFEIGSDPVHLLPGTIQELRLWLQRSGREALSAAGTLASGRLEQPALLFHLSSPIGRIRRLFQLGRVSTYAADQPRRNLDELLEICIHAMSAAAPHRHVRAVAHDCLNLAFVCISLKEKWLRDRAPVLVSRDRSLCAAERALIAGNSLQAAAPLIAHPIEWSYDTFLRQGRSVHTNARTSLDGDMIDHLLPAVLDTLRSPTPDRVAQLARTVPLLRYSLTQFTDHFAALATWFTHDVQWESHAWVEVERAHEWKKGMIRAHREVMAALSELELHVTRMMNAYERFMQR